ncbi:MAG TPA: 3-dehydroquinate synthase [Agriterribacter sp.]|nr:3-dehydroquinate synthase [Chitinophagaceae bacterium]HRP30966.1 3-dehydroquinate synthase [Agriterribacter sp.]
MSSTRYKFNNSLTQFYFDSSFSQLRKIADAKSAVLITDENVFSNHTKKFRNWNTIVLKPGEEFKVQATVDSIIEQLIGMAADRKTTLVGIGGGVVTDITGYAAATYMRGIPFGFVPTSVLGLVDASIGGKNGIDVGVYKNMVGTIRQPAFLLHDYSLLQSLPENEWQNGFAEIIKHACIKDAPMFKELEANSLKTYRQKKSAMRSLFRRNALIKIRVVQKDEFEKGDRRLLNFGHTLGHALENQYDLSHGQAIAIGMTYACHISSRLKRFKDTARVVKLLEQYGLPTYADFDTGKVLDVLKMDKKRERREINYVLLEKTGKAVIEALPLRQLEQLIEAL